jgi:DNA-binding MarR family transcriptional regulator
MTTSPDPARLRSALHAWGLARDRLMIGLGRQLGLTQPDLHAVEQLEALGPVTPGELQHRMGLTSGAVTAAVDRLERAGLVTRRANPDDRRSVLVSLSEKADRLASAELGAYHEGVQRALERVPPQHRAAVAALLKRLAACADSQADRYW